MSIASLTPVSLFDIGAAQRSDALSATTALQDSTKPDKSFGSYLKEAFNEINNSQAHADNLTAQFASGAPIDIHKVMVASQEASVALNLAVQLRNHIMDAYTQIMQTGV